MLVASVAAARLSVANPEAAKAELESALVLATEAGLATLEQRLRELAARHPRLSEVHYHLAMVLDRQQRWTEAIAELEKFLAGRPRRGMAEHARAELARLGRIAEGGPEQPSLIEERRLQQATAALSEGRPEVALSLARAAFLAHPTSHRGLRFASLVLEHEMEWVEAMTLDVEVALRVPSEADGAAQRVVELESTRRAAVLARVADRARAGGDHREAIRRWVDAWSHRPAESRYVKAAILEALGLRDMALSRALLTQWEAGGANPEEVRNLARRYPSLVRGAAEPSGALVDLLGDDSGSPRAIVAAAREALDAGHEGEAAQSLATLLQTDDFPEALLLAARVELAAGRTGRAVALATRAARAAPWCSTAWTVLGAAQRATGRSAQGVQSDRRAEALERIEVFRSLEWR